MSQPTPSGHSKALGQALMGFARSRMSSGWRPATPSRPTQTASRSRSLGARPGRSARPAL